MFHPNPQNLSKFKQAQKRLRKNFKPDTHHLEECQICDEYVVEVDFRVFPGTVQFGRLVQTLLYIGDDADVQFCAVLVDAAGESAAKQVDGHDAEDEPEDEADE